MDQRTGRRQTVFVCVALSNSGSLITRILAAETPKDATEVFKQENSFPPQEVLGPFYKKRSQVIENTRILKFAGKTVKASYNDWIVDAFLLSEPEDQAYLVFLKRCDGKTSPVPKGTIVVPVSDLRIVQ